MRTYIAKCGKTQIKQSLSTLLAAAQEDDNTGFCLACGGSQTGVEPDARRITCEACGEPKAYGAEELLLPQLPTVRVLIDDTPGWERPGWPATDGSRVYRQVDLAVRVSPNGARRSGRRD